MQHRFLLAFCLLVAACFRLSAQKGYTDYLPQYKTNMGEYLIEKIEYEGSEIVFHLSIAIAQKNYVKIIFYQPQNPMAWLLTSQDGTKSTLKSLKNVCRDGRLLSTEIKEQREFYATEAEESDAYAFFSCEVHFDLPPNAETLKLTEGEGEDSNLNNFNFFDIQIKSKNSKELGDKAAGDKRCAELKEKLKKGQTIEEEIRQSKPIQLTTQKEEYLTEALYRKNYLALRFACDEDAEFRSASVRKNLFATALLNDFSKRFDLGIRLQTEIGMNGKEVYSVNVIWNKERFGFYDCNNTGLSDTVITFHPTTFQEITTVYPPQANPYPMLNGFVELNMITQLDNKLQYLLYAYEDKNVEDWDFFIGQTTPTPQSRTIFAAHKADNYFMIRKVDTDKKTAFEVNYDLKTGKKIAEGSFRIIPESSKKIVVFDPFTFQEIEQTVITGESFERIGTWKFYTPDGTFLREEKY